MAPWLIGLFPDHHTYVEPFGGGASVLLQKRRAAVEVYNDLDGEIVNVFRVMRDHPAELIRAIELTPYAREEFEQSMLQSEDAIEQARRTIVRSFMCYGTSMTRTKRDGGLMRAGFRSLKRDAVSAGTDWSRLPESFRILADRIRGVLIENRDALDVIQANDSPETLHYVDPPYVHSTRSDVYGSHRFGYRHELSDAEHCRLAKVLNAVKGAVVISGYPSELYEQLYAGWERLDRRAHALNATERTEVVWMRNVRRGLLF